MLTDLQQSSEGHNCTGFTSSFRCCCAAGQEIKRLVISGPSHVCGRTRLPVVSSAQEIRSRYLVCMRSSGLHVSFLIVAPMPPGIHSQQRQQIPALITPQLIARSLIERLTIHPALTRKRSREQETGAHTTRAYAATFEQVHDRRYRQTQRTRRAIELARN